MSGDNIESECSFYLLNIAETNEYSNLEKSENVYFFRPTKKMDDAGISQDWLLTRCVVEG